VGERERGSVKQKSVAKKIIEKREKEII